MDSSDLSINNVRIHLSQIPVAWTEQLKTFFIKQPDFNEAVISAFANQVEANLSLQQKQQQLEQRIRKLEGK